MYNDFHCDKLFSGAMKQMKPYCNDVQNEILFVEDENDLFACKLCYQPGREHSIHSHLCNGVAVAENGLSMQCSVWITRWKDWAVENSKAIQADLVVQCGTLDDQTNLQQFNQDDLIEIIQKTREIAINTKLDSKGERIFKQQNVNVTTPIPIPIPTTLSTESIISLLESEIKELCKHYDSRGKGKTSLLTIEELLHTKESRTEA